MTSRRVLAWVSGTFLVCGTLGLLARLINAGEYDAVSQGSALAVTALGMFGLCVLVFTRE